MTLLQARTTKVLLIGRLLCLMVSLGLTLAFGDVVNLSTGFNVLNLSTGFNSSGTEITKDLGCDAHWTWTGSINGDTNPNPHPCGVAAQVVMKTDPDWWPSPHLIPNTTSSEWIARDATSPHNGNDTYSVFFNLPNDTGAMLSGLWAAEDEGNIYLNGHRIVVTAGDAVAFGSTFACGPGVKCIYQDLQNGRNKLTIQIYNSNDLYEGVRFQGHVTGMGASFVSPSDPPSVPEPSYALVLLLAGLGAVPFVLRRRQA